MPIWKASFKAKQNVQDTLVADIQAQPGAVQGPTITGPRQTTAGKHD